MIKIFLILGLLFIFPLQGEIQRVIVRWRALSCDQRCAQMIAQRFQATPGVASVNLNLAAQTVELGWNPTVPFTWQAIKLPMQQVGPGIDAIFVRVRGQILFQNNQFWIVSVGDNTAFALYGPSTMAQMRGAIARQNPLFHPLTPQLQGSLTFAMQPGRLAIIDGHLLQPHRSPPLRLSITQLQVVQ